MKISAVTKNVLGPAIVPTAIAVATKFLTNSQIGLAISIICAIGLYLNGLRKSLKTKTSFDKETGTITNTKWYGHVFKIYQNEDQKFMDNGDEPDEFIVLQTENPKYDIKPQAADDYISDDDDEFLDESDSKDDLNNALLGNQDYLYHYLKQNT